MDKKRLIPYLWLLPALGLVFGTVAVWNVEVQDPLPEAHWQEAAARVESRIRPGEMVMFYKTAQADNAAALRGMAVSCDTGGRGKEFSSVKPAGVWILGSRKLSRKLRKLKRKYGNGGSAEFGPVYIHHMWNQRPGKGGKR